MAYRRRPCTKCNHDMYKRDYPIMVHKVNKHDAYATREPQLESEQGDV
jgi:hypothetical protein